MDAVQKGDAQKVIRPAASLLIVRDGQEGVEVLTLKRSSTMRFLPNFLAFPGGTLDVEDWDEPTNFIKGSVNNAAQDDDASFALGALRECAEEVGWLCAVRETGEPSHVVKLSAEEQGALLENRSHFSDLLKVRNQNLDLSLLRFVGRWVTPAYMPARFDTRFFVMVAQEDTPEVQLVSPENDWIRWCRPRTLLMRISEGKEQAVPPTIAMLEGLSRFESAIDCIETLEVPGPPPED